jgi:cysteine synthase
MIGIAVGALCAIYGLRFILWINSKVEVNYLD